MPANEFPPPPPLSQRLIGRAAAGLPRLMRALARLESASVADDIAGQRLQRPVYIGGMARSGSTVLLEMLASVPGFVSLRYSDYPLHWLPYWWNALRRRLPLPQTALAERAHRDRLQVGPDSPEAFEENFWQAFFPGRHDETRDQRLDADAAVEPFASFYRNQLRKLLAVRGGQRYLCKGNYNLARLGCLQALLPDARFLVPVRAPLAQVASLVKQDRWFCRWSAADPRIGRQLALLGHYEFGLHKRVQHCGDDAAARAIRRAWDSGDLAYGYALQWQQIHASLLRRLEHAPALREASLVVGYEALCARPEAGIARIAGHIGLDAAAAHTLAAQWAPRLSLPDYYDDGLAAETRERIAELTAPTWTALQPLLA